MLGSKKRKALKAADVTVQLLSPVFHILRLQNSEQIPEKVKEDDFVLGYMMGAFYTIWRGTEIADDGLFTLALEKFYSIYFSSEGGVISRFCCICLRDETFKGYVDLGSSGMADILKEDVDSNQLVEHFQANY